MRYLALDVGGSGIKYAVADEGFNLSGKGLLPTCYTTHEEFIDAIADIRAGFGDLTGIAISTCGELDPDTGLMLTGGSLRFNAGTNILRSVGDRCHLPVSVENDANCAVIAELHDGALSECRNAMVVVLGTAVGGAIVIDGRIYHGSSFHAGNASYTRTSLSRPDSPLLAETGGVPGLLQEYARLTGAGGGASSESIVALASAGDRLAVAALQGYCFTLASFIYNAQMLLDLECVAIGGGISSEPVLVSTLRGAVATVFDLAPIPLPRPEVRACRYRNEANLIGALRHHLQALGDAKAA